MTTTTTTTTVPPVVRQLIDAMIAYAEHAAQLAAAGRRLAADGNAYAARAVLEVLDAEQCAAVDAVNARFGLVDGAEGFGDHFGLAVAVLVPDWSELAEDAVDAYPLGVAS
jgi:glutaminase